MKSRKNIARSLRKNMPDAEKHLWYHLRDRRLAGYKFRRQVPIGPFIADFLCLTEKVIVEIDGGQHALNKDADRQRTSFLNRMGYRVVRFWNNEVFAEKEAVLSRILAALRSSVPHPGPLSGGEGEVTCGSSGREGTSGFGGSSPLTPALSQWERGKTLSQDSSASSTTRPTIKGNQHTAGT
jgi:very-short-patch-repair endonuclease